jgi:C-terminal processing protease CtpA/Prc
LGFITLKNNMNMAVKRGTSALAVAALLLASCGGGGSAAPAPAPAPTASPAPTPTPSASASCALRTRQDWALAQLNEWYLFPSLLDAAVNPTSYPDVDSYVDALVAPARAQNRDRFFTYLTSIAEENAYYASGATAGFGVRLTFDSAARRLFISESFEGAPALGANIDRGDEITGIGTPGSAVQPISTLLANGGSAAITAALGPDTPGTQRTLRVRSLSGVEREVTLAKTDFALDPVSNRYGARVFTDGARKIGYLNLRTFIETADPDMRAAFADFKAQGVTEMIVDLRYNGGGLISTAELLNNLLGGQGRGGQVQGYVAFRDSKAAENETFLFAEQPESLRVGQIAFIVTGSSASASELVVNTFKPYLNAGLSLIGSNTFGKPVGQIALDRPACDDRLRVVALEIQNASREGNYYNGLAATISNNCRVADDLTRPLGDASEGMIKVALDKLAGRSCSPISLAATATASVGSGAAARRLLTMPEPDASTYQREVPGAY